MSSHAGKAVQPQPQYVLKFRDKLVKQALKASAALNGRSMNDEILYLIRRGQESVSAEGGRAAA